MVKRNKRQKAVFGIDDAIMLGIGLLSTAVNAGTSIMNTDKEINAQNRAQEAQRRANIFSGNAQNTSIFRSNLGQLANSEQEERSRVIPTQKPAFKLGGRRCKKNGGRLTKFI